ncbi:MAG: hypothetical protein ABIJ56_07355 [Pseudomonadota bacterium]
MIARERKVPAVLMVLLVALVILDSVFVPCHDLVIHASNDKLREHSHQPASLVSEQGHYPDGDECNHPDNVPCKSACYCVCHLPVLMQGVVADVESTCTGDLAPEPSVLLTQGYPETLYRPNIVS